jgi:hypothetical protein
MSSDRVEARRPGQSTRRARSMRGETYTAPRRPLRPACGLRLGDVLWARRSGAPFEGIRGRARGPREQNRTVIEFYTEVVTVYQER